MSWRLDDVDTAHSRSDTQTHTAGQINPLNMISGLALDVTGVCLGLLNVFANAAVCNDAALERLAALHYHCVTGFGAQSCGKT